MAVSFQPKTVAFTVRQMDAAYRMAELIERSLDAQRITGPVRIHGDGDYFSLPYMAAWCIVARRRPSQIFYSYTKSITLAVVCHDAGLIPPNLRLTASMGGRWDDLAQSRPDVFPKRAWVVLSESEADDRGWHIDHDDSTPMSEWQGDFALLLHGTQPKGSAAAKALQELKKRGIHGYGRSTGAKVKKPKLRTAAQCAEAGILYFSPGNAKVHGAVLFSIPAGHTCPGACACLAKADRQTGTVTDGPEVQFRCFAASAESRSPDLRRAVWHNLDTLASA